MEILLEKGSHLPTFVHEQVLERNQERKAIYRVCCFVWKVKATLKVAKDL